MDKHERRVVVFFAVLFAWMFGTIAYGFYTGEIKLGGKGCVEDYCEPEQ